MKYLMTILVCSLFLLTACKSTEYRKGYAEGVKEAKAEISKKSPTIYSHGDHYVGGKEFLKDPQTGLPIVFIAGCIVSEFVEGKAAGHNKTIKEHLKSVKPAQTARPAEITNNLSLSTEDLLNRESFKANLKLALGCMKSTETLKWKIPYNYEEHKDYIELAFRTKETRTKNNMVVVRIDRKTKKPYMIGIK